MDKRLQTQSFVLIVLGLFTCTTLFTQSGQTKLSIHNLIQIQTDKIYDSLVSIRRDIHENPELSFKEVRTSKLVAEYLSSIGLDVRTNVGGNGIVGILHGKGNGKIIGWRAEMDAYRTDLPDVVDFKSRVDGVRHICGHDVNTAIGLGIANVLSTLKDSIAGTVVFIFQPAEEAFGGAKLMLDDDLYNIIKPDEIYCSHVDDIPVGTVAIKSGAVFAYAVPISITYKNINLEDKDSIVSFTKSILTKYSNLDSQLWEKCADHEIGIFSINSIFKDFVSFTGGVSLQEKDQFIVLETAFLGDDEKQLDSLPDKLTGVIRHSALADYFVSVSSPGYSFMPYIKNDPELAEKAKITISTIYGQNTIRLMDGFPLPFNDDFAYLQKDIPCGYYILGGSNYNKGIISHPHTPDFEVDEKCIAVGVKYFSSMIVERFKAQ
jgi:metal-dependent amidase/aminoacylase/carboxypeptidase family protein